MNASNSSNTINATSSKNFTIPSSIHNGTSDYVIPGRQYENVTIPLWGFNSSCKNSTWVVATYVDLVLSGMGVFYNALIFLLPFFFARLYNTRGSFTSSYAIGCLLCSTYYVYFDLRVLFVQDDVTRVERGMLYLLMLFLAYHVVLHMYLLTWDQSRSVFRCKSHLRYATTSCLIKIGCIVWVTSFIMPIVEAIFLYRLSDVRQTNDMSQFRLLYIVSLLFFFWFLPLVFLTGWNGNLFSFLLKIVHHGYVIENMPRVNFYRDELMPELAPSPWFVRYSQEDDNSSDDEDELPTIPDDIRYELARCFLHLVVTTLFVAPVLSWFAYHVLALVRTGMDFSEQLEKDFYESIYNCHVFVSLYVMAKFIAILNPLCYFYCRPEIGKIMKCVIPCVQASKNTGNVSPSR